MTIPDAVPNPGRRVLDVGLGARRALDTPGAGKVLATYRRAAYLTLPGGLCALTTAAAPPGPLHLRCHDLPPCRPGERVHTDGRTLRAETWSLPLRAPTWVGPLPPADRLSGAIGAHELAGYAARLGGRGPGLTPAGDDVLAGLLLVASAAGSAGDTAALIAVAASVPTTGVAAGFLHWAARGQCIEPAHAVLAELASCGADADTPACARLTTIGSSSGAALLAGIRIGLGARAPQLDLHLL
ncbi:MAG TPA: DUF2877 domain-containing protein [Pseudonocardia sp.]|nr:DUF2877 domain-containing protein [Pseudonocardia sp.]